MASNDPELNQSGFSMPQWMRKKANTSDLEHSFPPASPPPQDDAFYIRYPRMENLFISKPPTSSITEETKIIANERKSTSSRDYSKHTRPCRGVMHGMDPIVTAVNPITAKHDIPNGSEESFKVTEEGGACGTSVVKMAHQIVSSKRGFTVATPSDDNDHNDADSNRYLKPDIDVGNYKLNSRRGSKSLPSSPMHSPPGSPTSRRRNVNRFFTSPFEPASGDSQHRSWLAMALLGYKKDLTGSSATLHEEGNTSVRAGSLAASVESLGPAPKTVREQVSTNENTNKSNTFRPKPSEYRELNFWSPTSM